MSDSSSIFSVNGKSAIVTGGASGLGYAIGEVLSHNGALVTLLDVDEAKLKAAVDKVGTGGGRVRTAVADIRDENALKAAFDEAAAAQAGLDIVFANAGIDPGGTGFADGDGAPIPGAEIEHYSVARWTNTLDVNLNGVFYTVREAARLMRGRGWGRIIITSSATAESSPPNVGVSYVVAKAGAAHLMREAAHELAPHGITVNAIAPGIFATDIKGKQADVDQAGMEAQLKKLIPLGRMGQPSEIQGLALYLASEASSYMTGNHILIDGGYKLRN